MIRAVLIGWLTGSGFDLALYLQAPLYFRSLSCYNILFFFVTLYTFSFDELNLVGLTWLTNHCPSVLWNCSWGHLTCKIPVIHEVTYNALSHLRGTINLLYYTIQHLWFSIITLLVCVINESVILLLLLVCVSWTIIGQPRNSVFIHRVYPR